VLGSGRLSGSGMVFGRVRLGLGFESRPSTAARHVTPNDQSQVVVKRAGMSLLVVDAEFREKVEYNARLHFELACQLIDPNFAHTVRH
jgi:hypothetical protein